MMAKEKKHLTWRALDHVLTDEPVSNAIYNYYVPSDTLPQDVFGHLTKNNITNVFTRKKNGKYSEYALSKFGFPNDVLHNCSDTESDSDF